MADESSTPTYPRRGLTHRPTARRRRQFVMQNPRRGSNVSSAALKKISDLAPVMTRLGQAWQQRAYELVESVGEASYVVNLVANAVASADLIPVKIDGDETTPTDDPRALRVMRAFVGPRGGQRELKRRAALHLQIGGEDHLLGTPIAPEDGEGIFWEFLSTEELIIDRAGHAVRTIEGEQIQVPPDAYIARNWRSDPRFSDRADSPIRHVLPILAELAILTQLIEAQIKSRIAAGLLFMPEELSFPGDIPDPDAEEPEDAEEIDEFSEELLKHLSAPIEDPTSAASLVPLLVRGPMDAGDKIRMVDLSTGGEAGEDWSRALRDEALTRLGMGLDIPPEVLTGKGNTNHWVAYELDADFVVKHVTPEGDLLADFLTHAYMRPMLVEFEGMAAEEAAQFAIQFDSSMLLARADEASTAKVLWDLGVISTDALLRSSGFDVGDAPDDQELRLRRLWQLIYAHPDVFGGLLAQLPGFEPPDQAQVNTQAPPGAPPAQTDVTPPDAQSGMEEPPRPQATTVLLERLAVAAESALERAYEKAGARVLSKAERAHLDLRGRQPNGDKHALLTWLRPGELDQLGETPDSLLAGAWDRLAFRTRQWVAAVLVANGCPAADAADRSTRVARTLVEGLDAYARENLCRPLRPGDDGLSVPRDLIQAAWTAGLEPALV